MVAQRNEYFAIAVGKTAPSLAEMRLVNSSRSASTRVFRRLYIQGSDKDRRFYGDRLVFGDQLTMGQDTK